MRFAGSSFLLVGALNVLIGLVALLHRVTGVMRAGIEAIAQIAFQPVYPAWSLLVITLDVVILWAILGHGGEGRGPVL